MKSVVLVSNEKLVEFSPCSLQRVTGNANRRTPRPKGNTLGPINNPTSTQDDENKACQICLANEKDMAFGCGHLKKFKQNHRTRNVSPAKGATTGSLLL
ncbi:hypothetical protein QVD17_16012 [Tagetes erecta]|uniref:Uncharacterized protein n=1 Tax=Tagetes erecta TaxID=13708 RepID=A0AAD8KR80_TARER|nr:hypothetical protein QVD17_16012 [Tagetes erecta]